MCGRYNVTKKLETVEKELSIKIIQRELFDGLINISPGDVAPVIASPESSEVSWFRFGLNPFWAKKPMYFFNARAEGDYNKENHVDFVGNKGILQKPSFRKPIRTQRCLVIATSFLEGSTKEKLSKPYLIFRNDFKTFTMGGIWDEWVDVSTGEVVRSFAIITTASNSITQQIDHHRAPLIIGPELRKTWLDPNTELSQITDMLAPSNGDEFNAYLIDNSIRSPKVKDINLLLPIDKPLKTVTETQIVEELELLGMGESPARKRKNESE